jgi:hypothetical protein
MVLLRIKTTHEPFSFAIGNAGGMFLKRIRVKKPGQEIFKSELSEYIKAEELYVGATVNVNGYLFLLLNADEYTLNYMEKNTDRVNLLYTILDLPFSLLHCVFFFL